MVDLSNVDTRVLDVVYEAMHFETPEQYDALALRLQELQDDACAMTEEEHRLVLNEREDTIRTLTADLAASKKAVELLTRAHTQMTDFVRQNDDFVMSISHSPNPLLRFLGRFAEWPRPFGDKVKRAQYDATIEAQAEMHRQDVKWGAGRQMPNGTSVELYEGQAQKAKESTDRAFAEGRGTWRHILFEEVFEAAAETNPKKLRVELIQVAAVALQWVAALMLQKPSKG